MASIEEIKARWEGAEPWAYDESNRAIVNPARLEGMRQTPQWVAQFFDKSEDDLPDYKTNGPRIAAAPVDIATLLIDREKTHELLRELQRACYAAIFGMPAEESTRLRKAIQDRLEALG